MYEIKHWKRIMVTKSQKLYSPSEKTTFDDRMVLTGTHTMSALGKHYDRESHCNKLNIARNSPF